MSNKLNEYQQKRDFSKSSEPSGSDSSNTTKQNLFVVQKHQARALHYDFRLQIDGVLASWAVPKGPSIDPSQKRLAIETEDHPLEYADFEGTIPKGQYGAGNVIIWDMGIYKNLKPEIPMDEARQQGRIEISLEGQKLRGAFALVRTGQDHNKQWLLIKMHDRYSSNRKNPVNNEPNSVVSGKTITEIGEE